MEPPERGKGMNGTEIPAATEALVDTFIVIFVIVILLGATAWLGWPFRDKDRSNFGWSGPTKQERKYHKKKEKEFVKSIREAQKAHDPLDDRRREDVYSD